MGGSKKKKGGGGGTAGEPTGPPALKVCGPTLVETLRGRLLGREVALICCGEAHEEALDLTREGCITEPEEGWVVVECTDNAGFDPAEAVASQDGLTLKAAKHWAERVMAKACEDSEDDSDEEPELEGYLLFQAGAGASPKGRATVFPGDLERSKNFPLPKGSRVLEWADLDEGARELNKRRLKGERVPSKEHDALIGERKKARLAEGIEFLDDWLLRQAQQPGSPYEVWALLESPVHPEEVELHVDSAAGPPPPAHECLRRLELDSDEDSEDDDDPDDGTGCFADYFFRRTTAELPKGRVRGVDPRDLGDAPDDALREAFVGLVGSTPKTADVEETELEALGAKLAAPEKDQDEPPAWKENRAARLPPVPSWEAFFGASAELLYYSPQVKADYAPFLARCVGSEKALWSFFNALYFQTVPEALAAVRLDAQTRPLAQIRSLAFQRTAGAALMRRSAVQSKIPVRAVPLDRYLKARGSDPPRTWTSGMAERLSQAGCAETVVAVQKWFQESVQYLLSDPKEADPEGDYFAAWLRACHRDIYDDIDRSDPEELKTKNWAHSLKHPKSKKHRHNLKDITIPGMQQALKELAAFDPGARVSTLRERVLAKIIVDVFQLRLVDVAMVLAVAEAVSASPAGARVVVVLYAGEDHTRSTVEFWSRRGGFSSKGLPAKGVVGKRDWEDDEPRALQFPPYLQDFRSLFPVPK